MPTRKIVPRANGEGAIGDNTTGAEKYWGGGYFLDLNGADAVEMASWNDSLQWKASASYASGDIVFKSGLKAGLYLECTTEGTSGSAKPTIPATVVPNTTTITDNTVTWTVREISSTQIDDSYSRQPSTAYQSGDIRFLYGVLPVGWFLECSTEGTSGSGDLTIATPTEGDTVTDGTVEWTIKKMGTGGGGDGVPLGAIIQWPINGTLPDGYLECDGRAVSRTMFPDLFDAIGTTYGAGDGSTTFNLPNYSDGKFPEGSTVAGTVKQPGLPNITGSGGTLRQNITPTGAFEHTGPNNYYNDAGAFDFLMQENFRFDASLSNPIYGASNTVQVYSCTTRFIIKAYDGVTPTPSQADISEMLTELTGKADRDLDNLSADGENHFLENDFTIIYPNGGSEASPANVTQNSRYVESNPFPNYYVACICEVYVNNMWSTPGWWANGTDCRGIKVGITDGNIVLQTGYNGLGNSPWYDGNASGTQLSATALPCRVKVWKIGKIPD
jgi:microcystin-dependent protein